MKSLNSSLGGSGLSQTTKAPWGLIFLVSAARAPRVVKMTTGQLPSILGYLRSLFTVDVFKNILSRSRPQSTTRALMGLGVQEDCYFSNNGNAVVNVRLSLAE